MRLGDLLRTWRLTGGTILAELWGGLILNGPLSGVTTLTMTGSLSTQGALTVEGATVLTYGPLIAVDASLGNLFTVTITDAVAFTISSPTNPPAAGSSQRIVIIASNTSGGAHGAGTWDAAFKSVAFPAIATGFQRSFAFNWNGVNWILEVQTAADVAN
jgi:hypothetical protein